MKKFNFSAIALVLAGSLMLSSCIGSFSWFNKYEKWQCNMSKSKILNGIVGLVLQPICAPVCAVVDALVLNTIEFWSGNNPMASNTQKVKGQDGTMYAVKTTRNGYKITSSTGEVTVLKHDAKTDTWSITQNGQTRDFLRFKADGTIETVLQNGDVLTVSVDEQGLRQVQEAVLAETYYAMR